MVKGEGAHCRRWTWVSCASCSRPPETNEINVQVHANQRKEKPNTRRLYYEIQTRNLKHLGTPRELGAKKNTSTPMMT